VKDHDEADRWLAQHGITATEIRNAVKAQLLFAAQAALSGAGEHDHIEDDCGDDIRNSLTPAQELHSAWHSSGVLESIDLLIEWSKDSEAADDESWHDGEEYRRSELCWLFGNGGVSPELEDLIAKIRSADVALLKGGTFS
jgi:hypothetical protein